MIGRRRDDTVDGTLPEEIIVGDYWKILDPETGEPKQVDHQGKLTKDCWHVVVPLNDGVDETGFGIARLVYHTVREHEDGSISVLPNDGSSNSILVTGARLKQWHGYIYNGEFRSA